MDEAGIIFLLLFLWATTLFGAFGMGAYSVGKDCSMMGKFYLSDKVFVCQREVKKDD